MFCPGPERQPQVPQRGEQPGLAGHHSRPLRVHRQPEQRAAGAARGLPGPGEHGQPCGGQDCRRHHEEPTAHEGWHHSRVPGKIPFYGIFQ